MSVSNFASDTPGVWTETEVFQVYISGTGISVGLMIIHQGFCQTLKIYKPLGKKGPQREIAIDQTKQEPRQLQELQGTNPRRGSLETCQFKRQWVLNNFQPTHSIRNQKSGVHSPPRSLHGKSRLSVGTLRNQSEPAMGLRETKAKIQTFQFLTGLG